MKFTLLIAAHALMAAALPVATNDVLSEIEAREASPVAEADPLFYIKRNGYSEKRDAEADPLFYIKRSGYAEKRDAEADLLFYIKRSGYAEKRDIELEVMA